MKSGICDGTQTKLLPGTPGSSIIDEEAWHQVGVIEPKAKESAA
jgi:hypothetical protein